MAVRGKGASARVGTVVIMLAMVSVPACPAVASQSPGCGHPAPARAPTSFVVGGIERQAIVVVPSGYRPDRPVPLVMACVGARRDANADDDLDAAIEATVRFVLRAVGADAAPPATSS